MKKYLEKIITAKTAQIDSIRAQIKASNDANEVRSLGETLESVLAELNDAKSQLAILDDMNKGEPEGARTEGTQSEGDSAGGAAVDGERGLNPMATYSVRAASDSSNKNMEKRLAFAKYVTRGVPIPAELREDSITNTTNAATAIPENLVTSIMEKLEAVGMILPLVTRTSFPVGQTIPVDSVKPVASWVAEGASSDVQSKGTLGSIVFGAFKLRCEIGLTQEVSVQTIAAFEALFVKQVSEAMVKAIEGKIISNSNGTDSPTGILYRASGSDATVEVAKGATGHLTYKLLCDAEALLPQQYEAGAKWFMSKATFMQFVAMTDSQGQPIARINYGIEGKAERTLLGRDVVLCGDYLPNYTEGTASEDVTFAFLFNPSDYVLNTSYDLGIQSKVDWDTENHLTKAVMSVDGKVVDRGSLVKLVKKYA